MNGPLRHARHLIRVAALFVGLFVVFLFAKAALVPKDFGLYGHYRPSALAANTTREVSYAGRAACVDCHTDVEETRKGSKHARIGCEACHGPLARHAADPGAQAPTKPDPKTFCLGCHAQNVGRPATFKQVDAEHSQGEPCSTCHGPHAPEKGPKP